MQITNVCTYVRKVEVPACLLNLTSGCPIDLKFVKNREYVNKDIFFIRLVHASAKMDFL